MLKSLQKAILGSLLLIAVSLSGGGLRRSEIPGATIPLATRMETGESLPAGMERSDWQGILAAHDEWKHAIREAPEPDGGWRTANPGTGLRATFDARGARIRPESGDWDWGLELASYGIGEEQRPVGERTPEIETAGRRIGYDWDGNLEEWYHNQPSGLEHGYTIRQRPEALGEEAPLELRLKVWGGLPDVEIIDEGRGATFRRVKGQALVRYSGLKVLDAEGREVVARLRAEGRGELRLVVEEQEASYPLTIDPTISQQAYLKASDTGAGQQFGHAVAISGETVVVGAQYDSSDARGVNGDPLNNNAEDSGAAYVFVRGAGGWTQQAYLKASNAGLFDTFGASVAIAGETIVVGATSEDSSATGINGDQANDASVESGAVYVFVRSGTTWSQQAYLKASNTGTFDNFGTSVAIAGETIVVGAPGEASNATGINGTQSNNSAPGAGAAYVFTRSGTTWSQQAYLKASNTGSSDEFGTSVAIAVDSIVVGAPSEASNAQGVNGIQSDNSAFGAGAVYVFTRTLTTWTQQAYLKASNTGSSDGFGRAVAIATNTVVVGASGEDSSASVINGNQANNSALEAGAAYVFLRSGSTWSQQAYLKPSNTGAGDQFGHSVAISGETVVVGANLEASNALGLNGNQSNNSAGGAGAAYVFVRSGTAWSQQAYFKASSRGAGGDAFGYSVAISGETVVVGAPYEDSGATGIDGDPTDNRVRYAGAAYVFVRSGGTWLQQAYLKADKTETFDLFGTSVAITGDTVVVGAQFQDFSGAAYVFVRSGSTWTQQAYLKASNARGGDQFGYSVAIAGETIVVGAPYEASNATGVNGNQLDSSIYGAGAAYIFTRNGTTWTQQAYLKASNSAEFDQFGVSVAIAGETVVVGALFEDSNATGINGNQSDNSATDAGAAYVFVRNGTIWSQQAYLKASNTGAGDQFGVSVAITAETVVVGAPSEDSSATGINGNQADNSRRSAGAAYVFVRSGTTWSQQAYLKASNTQIGDQFGSSVAIAIDSIVVGAPSEASNAQGVNGIQSDNSAFGAGAVYVFTRTLTTWSQLAYLKASNTGSNDYFGSSVSIAGQTVVIGAPYEASSSTGVNGNQADNLAGGAGAAYVFLTTQAPPPTITVAGGISREAGTNSAGTMIAMVSNQEAAAGSIQVTVNGGATATVNGVTLSNLVNTAGTITATLVVDCGAPLGTASFPLQVSNGSTAASAVLVVTVTANTPPVLTYLAAEVSTGGGATISPATGPTDQGTVSTIVIESVGTYTGTVSVDSQGRVALSNAGPVGTHTVTIRATDNCGLATTVPLQLTVSPPGGAGAVTGASGTIASSQGETVGPGNRVTITQTLTNNTASPITTTFRATLPAGLRAISCASSIGSCLLGAASGVVGGGSTLERQSAASSPIVSQTGAGAISWTGTIPGNGSATITYQVQVDLQASEGSQYCVTSTIGGGPGPTTCVTVTTPPAAPGTLPIAAGLPNQQKPGSVLIYNLYTSSANRASSDTLITLTNTNPANSAMVALFFVDGANGVVADQTVQLTKNQTISFLASDYDPGVTGYLIAVSIDRNGCPTVANDLIGGALVRLESGHRAALAAIGVAGLRIADPPCQSNLMTARLAFDGVNYDELPRALAVYDLPALENGISALLVVNRIGGNLLTGADKLSSLLGVIIDQGAQSQSFSLAGQVSQLRGLLGNTFPRTVPRYTSVIPSGATGWMKFWATEDEAISGAMIIDAPVGLRGGYNLPVLSTTSRATFIMPVFPRVP